MVKIIRDPFACIRAKNLPPRLQAKIDEVEEAARRAFPDETDTEIAARVDAALETILGDRERATYIHIEKQIANDQAIETVTEPNRRLRRILATIEGDVRRRDVDIKSVHDGWNVNRAILHNMMMEPIISFLRRVWTPGMSRNKGTHWQGIKEVFGETTGNAFAKRYAEGYHSAVEFYVNFMRKHGVPMRKYDRTVKQFIVEHAPAKILRATEQEWAEDIIPKLDLARMIDPETEMPYTRESLLAKLPEIRQSILTGGVNSLKPGARQGLPFWSRIDESQFFVWKDFKAWSEYNAKYGFDDPLMAMMRNLDMRARNMALAEVLGPDPEGQASHLIDLANRAGAEAGKQGNAWAKKVQVAFDMVRGESGKPSAVWLAEAGESTRQVMNSALLGGLGPLAMLADNVTAGQARLLAGLSTKLQLPEFFGGMLELIGRGPQSRRVRESLEIGTSLQSVAHSTIGSMRGIGEMHPWRWSHYLADTSFRAFGLTVVTDAIQSGYIRDWHRALIRNLGRGFDSFDNPRIAETMRIYGIEEADWLKISARASEFKTDGGLLRLPDMARSGLYDEASRLIKMLEWEKDTQAVITAAPETRRHLARGLAPGSVEGEAIRFATHYMQWPVTYMMSKIMGLFLTDYLKTPTKLAFFGGMAVSLAVIGGLVTQFRQITAGKDPYDWGDPRLWIQGLAVGGSFGIIGDFLFREHYGSTDQVLFDHMGPGVALLSQLVGIPLGATQAAFTGEPFNIGREAIKLGRVVTPFSSAWPFRAAIDRMFFDTLQRWVDPNAYELFRARTLAPMRERNQQYWWVPGTGSPSRGPQL